MHATGYNVKGVYELKVCTAKRLIIMEDRQRHYLGVNACRGKVFNIYVVS